MTATPTAEFTRNPDASVQHEALLAKLTHAAGAAQLSRINAQEAALQHLGDSIGANILLMGYAWQLGVIPVGLPALMRAIELNGVAIDLNKRAFMLGRLAAAEPAALGQPGGVSGPAPQPVQFIAPQSLEQLLATRVRILTQYQNAAYAERYRALVASVSACEQALSGGTTRLPLSKAVARSLFKLMAYKDEYEVARLHADPAFAQRLAQQFEGDYTLQFHLAPPLLTRWLSSNGQPRKVALGGWMRHGFALLARLKGLRGTFFDPFGHTDERRRERACRDDYMAWLASLPTTLTPANLATAVKLAQLPEKIRGYGHVKLAAMAEVEREKAQLMADFTRPATVGPQTMPAGLSAAA